MSSFRPDVPAALSGFVPTTLAGRGWATVAPSAPLAEDGGLAVAAGAVSDLPGNDAAETAPPSAEQIASLEQAAFDRGVESVRSGQEALAATCRGMDEAISALRAAAATDVSANRRLALDLCRDLVRHWLQDELRIDAPRYAEYLDRALAGVEDRGVARIRVAAEDLERLQADAAESLARWASEGIVVEIEPGLTAGDFRIEWPSASLDGRLDAIADRLRAAMQPAIATAPPAAEPEIPAAGPSPSTDAVSPSEHEPEDEA